MSNGGSRSPRPLPARRPPGRRVGATTPTSRRLRSIFLERQNSFIRHSSIVIRHSPSPSRLPISILCFLSSVVCHLPSAFCPLSSVLCFLSSVLCPLLSALCPLSSVLCPLPSVLCYLSSVFFITVSACPDSIGCPHPGNRRCFPTLPYRLRPFRMRYIPDGPCRCHADGKWYRRF